MPTTKRKPAARKAPAQAATINTAYTAELLPATHGAGTGVVVAAESSSILLNARVTDDLRKIACSRRKQALQTELNAAVKVAKGEEAAVAAAAKALKNAVAAAAVAPEFERNVAKFAAAARDVGITAKVGEFVVSAGGDVSADAVDDEDGEPRAVAGNSLHVTVVVTLTKKYGTEPFELSHTQAVPADVRKAARALELATARSKDATDKANAVSRLVSPKALADYAEQIDTRLAEMRLQSGEETAQLLEQLSAGGWDEALAQLQLPG